MELRTDKEKRVDAIYRLYADDIYKVCFYFTKDKKVAQEVAQRTFIEFYKCFSNVEADYVRTLLIRIAKDIIFSMEEKEGL